MILSCNNQFVKKITKSILLVLLALIIAPLLVVNAQSSNPPTDDEVNAVAKGLYCPVCENVPLDVCPTQACAQWREMIREKLTEGWTEDEIKQYFVNQYGDRVLSEPPRTGLNWLVYILPPVIFLAGAFFVYQNLRGLKKKSNINQDTVEMESDKYAAQVEDALKALIESEKE